MWPLQPESDITEFVKNKYLAGHINGVTTNNNNYKDSPLLYRNGKLFVKYDEINFDTQDGNPVLTLKWKRISVFETHFKDGFTETPPVNSTLNLERIKGIVELGFN